MSLSNAGAELALVANTIRDTDLKFIFKRLAKKSESETTAALEELLKLLPDMNSDTFSEIVGHICLVFEYLFFNNSEHIRVLAVSVIKMVIGKLKKDIAGYATLIFPTLLIYMNDDSDKVAKDAKEIFDTTFSTSERKAQVIVKMQSDICDKIVSFASSLSRDYRSSNGYHS